MSRPAIDEIQRLYYETTARTIERDVKRAVEILKTLPDEEARARAAVFMDGLSQMRSEWRLEKQRRQTARRKLDKGNPSARRAKAKGSQKGS